VVVGSLIVPPNTFPKGTKFEIKPLKEKIPSKNEDRCSEQTQDSVGFEVIARDKNNNKIQPRKNSRFILQLKRNFLNTMTTRKLVLELNNKNKKNGSVQLS
jgi:hypothetical protein